MANAEKAEQLEQATNRVTAPYPAFQTLKTLIKPFKEHGAPPSKIDRSVLNSFSGQVGSQVLTMLKFLRLTDDDGRPTGSLESLIKAFDTDAWPTALEKVVREAYAPLLKTNLEAASPNEFNDAFRRCYPAAEEVSRKSKTFFLNAAREAGIKISPYIMKNKKPRSAPTKKRVVKSKDSSAAVKKPREQDPKNDDQVVTNKLPSEILLGLFDPGTMDGTTQDAIWTLIKHFKGKGQ